MTPSAFVFGTLALVSIGFAVVFFVIGPVFLALSYLKERK